MGVLGRARQFELTGFPLNAYVQLILHGVTSYFAAVIWPFQRTRMIN